MSGLGRSDPTSLLSEGSYLTGRVAIAICVRYRYVCCLQSTECYIVAPRPSFVFFIFATSGASKPPDRPILSPSAQPMLASMRNPMFDSPILGAAWTVTPASEMFAGGDLFCSPCRLPRLRDVWRGSVSSSYPCPCLRQVHPTYCLCWFSKRV